MCDGLSDREREAMEEAWLRVFEMPDAESEAAIPLSDALAEDHELAVGFRDGFCAALAFSEAQPQGDRLDSAPVGVEKDGAREASVAEQRRENVRDGDHHENVEAGSSPRPHPEAASGQANGPVCAVCGDKCVLMEPDGSKAQPCYACQPAGITLEQALIDGWRDRATVTVGVAGEVLGISRASAYAAAGTGELPVIHVGRRLLVPVAALRRLLGELPENDKRPYPAAPSSAEVEAARAATREDCR